MKWSKKNSNENVEQYVWRMCLLHDDGDLGWDEITDAINKELFGDDTDKYYGESKYRKEFQNAKKFYDAGVFDGKLDDEHLRTLQAQNNEIYKEKILLSDERREYNRMRTADARMERLHSEIIEAAKSLNKLKPLEYSFHPIPSYYNKEAILCLSDWHYGMVTDNIWNTYNTEVCRARVEQLYTLASDAIMTHMIKKLHIVMLGDAAHGAIHGVCRVQAEENTCDQLMQVSEIMADLINDLSKLVEEVNVYSCYGNHLRTVQKKEDSIHSDNMEKIIPWWIKERLSSNKKVHVIDSPYYEFTKFTICGKNICCLHGDLDTFKDIGLTVNTIFTKKFGETIDYTISGDKHHLEELERYGVESILVRSLCGTDDYANSKRLYSKAGQTLIIFNNAYGRECTYNFPLD